MTNNFEKLLELALEEDLGEEGDVSSRAIFSDETDRAAVFAREDLRLAGLEYAVRVFKKVDPAVAVEVFAKDGDDVSAGQKVLTVEGRVLSLLKSERIALNFMGYLSGIATQTRRLSGLLRSLGTTCLLDTRKTLPAYRGLAKEAVRFGGGTNHRQGLYDMVLIKDNHIDAAGGLGPAIDRTRGRWGSRFKIEVECKNLDEVKVALAKNVEIVMLDNMAPEDCSRALELRKREFSGSVTAFEASGDMDEEKIKRYAALGLDFISVGRLTHSVRNANFSMRMVR